MFYRADGGASGQETAPQPLEAPVRAIPIASFSEGVQPEVVAAISVLRKILQDLSARTTILEGGDPNIQILDRRIQLLETRIEHLERK